MPWGSTKLVLGFVFSQFHCGQKVESDKHDFFSCIAGLVRDMVGQQLELIVKTNFPEKRNNRETNPTNKQHPHTRQAPSQAESPGKFTSQVKQVKHTRPSQPLKDSLPPSSNSPRCPCLDVSHINICTLIPRRVSNVWKTSTLELIRTLSRLPPFLRNSP